MTTTEPTSRRPRCATYGRPSASTPSMRFPPAIAGSEAAYQASTSTVAGQAELAEAGDAVPNDAYCLARFGRFAAAVERLEGGRARALADALAFERVGLDAAVAEDRRAFGTARERIR